MCTLELPLCGNSNVYQQHMLLTLRKLILKYTLTVILLPAHPASFAHNFVSGMQSFDFSESLHAIVFHTCH